MHRTHQAEYATGDSPLPLRQTVLPVTPKSIILRGRVTG